MSTVEFTSDVVRSVKFRDKMRGYHPEEVDAFLERAAAALELLETRLAETTERALKAETALESNSEADESIRRTLMLAQRTAELAVNEANDDARRIRDEAQSDVERQRAESEAACATLVIDAGAEADTLRAQAKEALDTAQAEAATTIAAAAQEAEQRHEACDEAIDRAERESAEGIDEARTAAETAMAAEADTARRELEANVASLSAQRADLRAHVEALSDYLASERARVLDTLASALESFGTSLSTSARPAIVEIAMHADPAPTTTTTMWVPDQEVLAADTTPDVMTAGSDEEPSGVAIEPDDEAVERRDEAIESGLPSDRSDSLEAWIPQAANPEPAPPEHEVTEEMEPEISNADALASGPASVWFPETAGEPVTQDAEGTQPDPEAEETPDQTAPSTLLFTLEDEMRREIAAQEANAADSKPRKSLLGRRRD
jgi:DivIVA domain-containing protein